MTRLRNIRVGDKIIDPEALQNLVAEEWRDVADDLVENALAAIGDERGSVEIERMPEPDGRADTFDAYVTAERERQMAKRAERALAPILESLLPAAMKPDDVAQLEAFRAELRKPAGREVMLGSIEALIADLNKPRLSLFRGRAEALAMPAPVMLVDRIIPAGKLILPYGSTGEGKTYFGIDIARRLRCAAGLRRVQDQSAGRRRRCGDLCRGGLPRGRPSRRWRSSSIIGAAWTGWCSRPTSPSR